MSLAVELALSSLVVLGSVFVHGGGLVLIGRILARLERRARCNVRPLSWSSASMTAVVTLGLLALSGLEIWGYAILFLVLGAISDLPDAIYFSTTTYAAIAAPDTMIAPSWRIAGAIEGINGLMLVGWSVAFFVTELQRLAHSGANRPVRLTPSSQPVAELINLSPATTGAVRTGIPAGLNDPEPRT